MSDNNDLATRNLDGDGTTAAQTRRYGKVY